MTTTRLTGWLAYVRKLLAVAAGLAVLALAQGLLDGNAATVAQAVITVATLAGVYKAPNGPRPGTPPKAPGGTVPLGEPTDGGNHAER